MVSDQGEKGGAIISPKKLSPSEIIAAHQSKERTKFNLYNSERSSDIKITQFLNIGLYSHHCDSTVPIGEPLFRPNPPIVEFHGYRALRTYETHLYLRNNDNVARRCKVFPPDSQFFEVIPSKANRDKVAPGIEVCYTVRFKPDSRNDYSYDLCVVTEREKFLVPIRATGYHALLDLPDVVEFGNECPVRYESQKTILMRNIGEKPTRFFFKAPGPFSVSLTDGYLDPGGSLQIQVYFKPDRIDQEYERDLVLTYGDSAPINAYVKLRGRAVNVDIQFSTRNLVLHDTYIALLSQATIDIYNNSDIPVDFSWRAFPNSEDEIQQKLKLGVQLREEETEEQLFLEHMALDDDDDEHAEYESDSDEESNQFIKRGAAQIDALARKYKNISKAVLEDPMYFYDVIFAIEPLSASIWAKSKITITVSFSPKSALHYHCLAYCSIVGLMDRIPIKLTGHGIGPKATFSFDELDVGDIYVESKHRYEVDILNQGDISVCFDLIPNTTPFGSKFSFTPSSGKLDVDSQETIEIEFCPNILGEFSETFLWELSSNNKSACQIPISFKGVSVCPTFHFDVDRINFGVVSYGFLNCKTITLSNDSEVTMRYVLRIPGDGRFLQKEFDIIPSKGVLLPNCSQKIQVDFISTQANPTKQYDLALVVDLDGVGQELGSVPIVARCAVPTVAFEPYETISFGEVFIRYAFYQCLVLHNTSALPAKFQILPQDDQTRQIASFEADQTQGNVPPASSHVISITLVARKIPGGGATAAAGEPGRQIRIPMYVKILGQPVPYPFTLTAIPIGPRVEVDQHRIDWGSVKCLQKVTKTLRVTNNSVIDASVRCFMKNKSSLWTVKPKKLHLSPGETVPVEISLIIDEKQPMTDVLHLIVHEGNDLQVNLKAKGTGTPVTTADWQGGTNGIIDFGVVYATQTHTREIIVENRGKKPRKLIWSSEKLEALRKYLAKKPDDEGDAKKKNKKAEEEKILAMTPVFSVGPDNILLEGKNAFRFTFTALSQRAGSITEILTCTEFVGNDRKGQIVLKCEVKAEFVAPLLQLSKTCLEYKFSWEGANADRYRDFDVISKPLHVTNASPLNIKFNLKCPYPFKIDKEQMSLKPGEKHTFKIEFDPSYRSDKMCDINKQKLTITYADHPQKDTIDLIGEVVFPNLNFEARSVNFGAILNQTAKTCTLHISNPYPLPVNYQWSLVDDDEIEILVDGQKVKIPLGQVFDILPIAGCLESGDSFDAQFTYFGLGNRKVETLFVCLVDGGPDYDVSVTGQASNVDFKLDKSDIAIGDVLFTQTVERDVTLRNCGKVPCYFNVDISSLERPSVVDIHPLLGLILPEEKQSFKVKFCPGIPDYIEETIYVSVAHFEPIPFKITGRGIFPGLVFNLERANIEKHLLDKEEARIRLERRMQISTTGQSFHSSSNNTHTTSSDKALNGGKGKIDKKASILGLNGTYSADGANSGSRPPSASSKDSFPRGSNNGVRSVGTNALHASLNAFPPPHGHETPRSNAADSALMRQKKEAELNLAIENEIDRQHLCEILLAHEAEMFLQARLAAEAAAASGGRGSPKKEKGMKKLKGNDVVAASYVCDFSYIVLGHSKKKPIPIHNFTDETVLFEINKKALAEYGFRIEPANAKSIPPKDLITLTCEAYSALPAEESEKKKDDEPSVQTEGPVQFSWRIPIRQGPLYEVHLKAYYVLPEVILSSDEINFGKVIIGQKKTLFVGVKNKKPVPVEWSYRAPRGAYGRAMEPWNLTYSIEPETGILQPDEIQIIKVSFTPNAATNFKQKLALRVKDNPHKKVLTVFGQGEYLEMNVSHDDIKLGACLPYYERSMKGIYLENPTDYTITVYSTDFDKEYREEEKMLSIYKEYNSQSKLCEFPIRKEGEGTWYEVIDTWEQEQAVIKHEEERQERKKERENNTFKEKAEELNRTVSEIKDAYKFMIRLYWASEYERLKTAKEEALAEKALAEKAAVKSSKAKDKDDNKSDKEKSDKEKSEILGGLIINNTTGSNGLINNNTTGSNTTGSSVIMAPWDEFPDQIPTEDEINDIFLWLPLFSSGSGSGNPPVDSVDSEAERAEKMQQAFDTQLLNISKRCDDYAQAFANAMSSGIGVSALTHEGISINPAAGSSSTTTGGGKIIDPAFLLPPIEVIIPFERDQLWDPKNGKPVVSMKPLIQTEFDCLQEIMQDLGLEQDKFPYRVPSSKRMNLIIHGPQRSGRTRLANQFHSATHRGFLNIDQIVDWALSGSAPKIFEPEFLDKIRNHITEKETAWETNPAEKAEDEAKVPYRDIVDSTTLPPRAGEDPKPKFPTYDLETEDVAFILKKRLQLHDFNTGFILNGFTNCFKYLTPIKVAELLLNHLDEHCHVILMNPAEPPPVPDDEGNLPEKPDLSALTEEEIVKRNADLYEANLKYFYSFRTQEITDPEIERQIAELTEQKDAGNAIDESSLEVLTAKKASNDAEIAFLTTLQDAGNLTKNREYFEFFRNKLREVSGPLNEKKRAEEEERLRIEKEKGKKGGKKSIAKKPDEKQQMQRSSQGAASQGAATGGELESGGSFEARSFEASSSGESFNHEGGDFHKEIECILPYDADTRAVMPGAEDLLPPPAVPDEPPLPPPKFSQLVYQPDRLERDFALWDIYNRSINKFTILTPVNSQPEPLIPPETPEPPPSSSEAAGHGVATNGGGDTTASGVVAGLEGGAGTTTTPPEPGDEEAIEKEPEKTEEELLDLSQCTQQTRWILPPKSKRKVFVKFFSRKVETVTCTLHFEVVSGYNYLHNNGALVMELKKHCNQIVDSNQELYELEHPEEFIEDPKKKNPNTPSNSPAKKTKKEDNPAAFYMPHPPVMIYRKLMTVSGTTAFPHINPDPRNLFMRRMKNRPLPPVYASRQFILSKNVYEFGPLLVGKDPESRFFYDQFLLEAPKRQQMLLDKQIIEREQTGYVFSMEKNTQESWHNNQEDQEANSEAARLQRERDNQQFFLRKHVESFRITNNSLFGLTVYFCLGSAATVVGTTQKMSEKLKAVTDLLAANNSTPNNNSYDTLVPNRDTALPFPNALFEDYPFLVTPEVIDLAQGETKDVTVWSFPVKEGEFKDELICTVDHNPECIIIPLQCKGTIPKIDIFPKSLDFDRLMERQSDTRECVIKNISCCPVFWKLDNKFQKDINEEIDPINIEITIPFDFSVEPIIEGILLPGQTQNLNIIFKASSKASLFNFKLKIAIQDTEGFYSSNLGKNIIEQDHPTKEFLKIKHTIPEIEINEIDIIGECFIVDVEPRIPENGLDFGSLKVGQKKEESFEIINNGKYSVKYELKIKKKSIVEILQIKDEIGRDIEIKPGEARCIKVTALSFKQIRIHQSPEITLKIYEAKSMERASVLWNIKLSIQAVYNSFTITPPRGLNFGPVRSGADAKIRTFEIRNDGVFPFDWCLLDLPPAMNDPQIISSTNNNTNNRSPNNNGAGGGKNSPSRGNNSPSSRGNSPIRNTERFVDPSVLARPPQEYFTPSLKIGPFSVEPSSGTLEPSNGGEKSIQKITVKFEPNGDVDEDRKLGLWVDGIQADLSELVRVGDFNNSLYLLTGQSCIPGIDNNIAWIFEEHYVAKNLEDAIATAGRVDIKCFSEEDRVFSFGPCLAVGDEGGAPQLSEKKQTERLRITNPKGIPCEVNVSLKPRSANSDHPFDIQPAQLQIPPHEHRYVTINFFPPQLQTYHSIFEAKVSEGTDPRTNYLTFEIRGDGTVPSITLDGVESLASGNAYDFGRLQLGRQHQIQFRLRNDGIIPATARCEILDENDNAVTDTLPHFSIICPSTINLEPGRSYEFISKFHPCTVGDFIQQFRIYTIHNNFEDVKLKLQGSGYVQDVSWDLLNQPELGNDDPLDQTLLDGQGKLVDHGQLDRTSAAAGIVKRGGNLKPPAPPDELGLGELQIGSKKSQTIYLKNNSKRQIRFEFPEQLPPPFALSADNNIMEVNQANQNHGGRTANLLIQPSCGHVAPNSRKKITVIFQPCEKVDADLVEIPCKIQDIVFRDAEEEEENEEDIFRNVTRSEQLRLMKPLMDWDDTMTFTVEEEREVPIEGKLGDIPEGFGHTPADGMSPSGNIINGGNAGGGGQGDESVDGEGKIEIPTEIVKVKVQKQRPEPKHSVMEHEGAERDMPLKVTAVADRRGLECEIDHINFAPTLMYQAKIYKFCVKNTSAISMPFEWLVKNTQTHRKNYEITPKTGNLNADSSIEFTVRFQPSEVEDFRGELALCTFKQQLFGDPSGKTSPVFVAHGDTNQYIEYGDEDDLNDELEIAHRIAVNGSAVRPLCHFEVPPSSDYKERRQISTEIDPKCQVIEFPPSLGTRVRNTKRFYLLNPTGESYDFIWTQESSSKGNEEDSSNNASNNASNNSPFRCLTKHGHVLSGKKFEMVFEYLPVSTGIHESYWTFQVIGKNVEQNFLIVGSVKEPRVGFQQPFINFGRLLLGGKARETLKLVNKEHIPFSFHFDRTSYGHQPNRTVGNNDHNNDHGSKAPTIFINPESGVVGPNSSFPIELIFKPVIEETVSHNVVCKIKRKEQPLALKVKGEGYKIHANLFLVDSPTTTTASATTSSGVGGGSTAISSIIGGRDRLLQPGVKEILDFGSNLQVHEKRSISLILKNAGSFNFDFVWTIIYQGKKIGGYQNKVEDAAAAVRRSSVLPPYISISEMQGVAPQEGEIGIDIEYAPLDSHSLDGCVLKMMIPSARNKNLGSIDESCYIIELMGRARRPQIDFSFTNYDFGYCFIDNKRGTSATSTIIDGNIPRNNKKFNCCKKVDLIVTNRDLSDCLLSTTFQRNPYLDVQIDQSMIEAGQSLIVPIVFSPKDEVVYHQRIEFIINDFTKFHVNVRGKGTALKLELVSMEMQSIDFGVTLGNKAPPIHRSVRIINRSPCTAEFRILDQDQKLRDRNVYWQTPMGGSMSLKTGTSDHQITTDHQQSKQRIAVQQVITLRPKEQCPIDFYFAPKFRVSPFKLPFIIQCQQTGELLNMSTISGESHATEIKLSEHSILFPPVVVQSRASDKVHLHNFGDLGSKYRFEIPQRYADVFFINPLSGYVAPHDDVVLDVSFHPKTVTERDITCENIVCVLDNHEPIRLSLTGRCISQPPDAVHTLEFETEVRKEQTQQITFPPNGMNINITGGVWKLQPEVKTIYPYNTVLPNVQTVGMGSSNYGNMGKVETTVPPYFFCAPEIILTPDKPTTQIDVSYKPLSMTKSLEETPTAAVHKGSLFIATPDGRAYVYELVGKANPPTLDQRIEVEIPCKTSHTQSIPITNWLNQRQRFNVTLTLIEPKPDSEEASAIKISGIDLFDLPPKLRREYKFQIYSYKQMPTNVLILAEFKNPLTGEYLKIEVVFKFTEPKSLGLIKFETPCRQVSKWPVMLSNPLSKTVKFTCTSTIPDIFFLPNGSSFDVQPGEEIFFEVCFRPTSINQSNNNTNNTEGEGEGEVVLTCPELGNYPYKVIWKVLPPAMEKAVICKAPLGSSIIEVFKFFHYSKKPTIYTAQIYNNNNNNNNNTSNNNVDFSIETKEIKVGEGPIEVKVDIKFTPSTMSEQKSVLHLTSSEGEYKSMLIGFCQPPLPQGPIMINNKKPENIEFRNPFNTIQEFSFQVGNPDDWVLKVPQKNKIEPLKTLSIGIEFKGQTPSGSRLVITSEKLQTPWVYFLKGTTA